MAILSEALLPSNRALKKSVGILNVKVIRAHKLNKKDLMGKSDPYVKLRLTEDKLSSKKTTVKKSNLNPEWNEVFKLVVKDPESQALELLVYDWEKVCFHLFIYEFTICNSLNIQVFTSLGWET